jgi:hypothetical protein
MVRQLYHDGAKCSCHFYVYFCVHQLGSSSFQQNCCARTFFHVNTINQMSSFVLLRLTRSSRNSHAGDLGGLFQNHPYACGQVIENMLTWLAPTLAARTLVNGSAPSSHCVVRDVPFCAALGPLANKNKVASFTRVLISG